MSYIAFNILNVVALAIALVFEVIFPSIALVFLVIQIAIVIPAFIIYVRSDRN